LAGEGGQIQSFKTHVGEKRSRKETKKKRDQTGGVKGFGANEGYEPFLTSFWSREGVRRKGGSDGRRMGIFNSTPTMRHIRKNGQLGTASSGGRGKGVSEENPL